VLYKNKIYKNMYSDKNKPLWRRHNRLPLILILRVRNVICRANCIVARAIRFLDSPSPAYNDYSCPNKTSWVMLWTHRLRTREITVGRETSANLLTELRHGCGSIASVSAHLWWPDQARRGGRSARWVGLGRFAVAHVWDCDRSIRLH